MIIIDLTMRQIFRYSLLPEVSPRIVSMIKSGFKNLSYFMALIYRAVNLLPENHAYLKPENFGKFSIRDVLSAAAGNLTFSTKHIDQIIIFFALIIGIVLLALQFLIMLSSFAISTASAQASMPTNYAQFFTTASPKDDLALRLLDQVFGLPDFFGSKDAGTNAFHMALHQLFQFYSTGLLVIAVMLVVYFIFAVLAETAQTGTPFGKRFNHVWAPLRLVAAIGLLIPIGTGLNAAQWITLHAAKFGSGFATNGWIKFNETITDTYIPKEELVAIPNIPALHDLAAFMMIAHACKQAYIEERPDIGDKIDAYIIDPQNVNPAVLALPGTDPRKHTSGNTLHIRFGEKDSAYNDSDSHVFPYCGDLVLTGVSEDAKNGEDSGEGLTGTEIIRWRYYVLVTRMWNDGGAAMSKQVEEAAKKMIEKRLTNNNNIEDPGPEVKEEILKMATKFIQDGINIAVTKFQEEFEKEENVAKLGWGGAGIWYNRIAQINGDMTNAVMNTPQLKAYPHPMEYTCEQNNQENTQTDPAKCYNTRLAGGLAIQFVSEREKAIAVALSDVFDYWHKDTDGKAANAFIDVVNAVIGTQGLFDMCKNADIHPLAQLSSVGKGLVEAAIRNLGYALGTGAAGILAPFFGPALKAASGFFVTVASIGILIGFILYYIVPFLPFLYFLFAVGGWVKGLFEAMVGVPLWALAHIRIDGQGLPGDAAINGYFLIFEIFIRPILIVFGLLASILIFGAMVKILNEVFSLVVTNLSGNDGTAATTCGSGTKITTGEPTTGSIDYFRGPVDEFFFTIVYAIMVYMIGMSSFKLIDLIPNNILRWMGAGVSTFNDQAGEPAEGLLSKMAIGGSMMGQQLQVAGSQGTKAVGDFGAAMKSQK